MNFLGFHRFQRWQIIVAPHLIPLHWQTAVLFIRVLHPIHYFSKFQASEFQICEFSLNNSQTSRGTPHMSASFVKRECLMIASGAGSSSRDLSTASRRRRIPSCRITRRVASPFPCVKAWACATAHLLSSQAWNEFTSPAVQSQIPRETRAGFLFPESN